MPKRNRTDTVQINFRVSEALRRKLNGAAFRNGTSINNEMRVRLEQSFEDESKRMFIDVAEDLKIAWQRFGERFVIRELESDILAALEARDFERAHAYAIAIRRTQEAAAKERTQRIERE
jgi:hypothetical protein